MLKYSLNGKWTFHEVGSDKWMDGTVPGCNFTDLMHNGKIVNPFIGMNEKEVQWVGERDWEYMRDFTLSAEMLKKKKIILECDMLDTIAEIHVNDKLVAKTNNMNIGYKFDITNVVCKLTNKIRIKFHSPVNYVENMQEKDGMPNPMGLKGMPHLRKAQCHTGWDWGPSLPLSGIMKDIRIVAYDDVRLGDILIKQVHKNDIVTIETTVGIDGEASGKPDIKIEIISPEGKSYECIGGLRDKSYDIEISDPKLWWPNDISVEEKQPLYKVKVSLISGGTTIDVVEKKIGLRTIELNREKDKYGRNFQFIVNGTPIFAKGANWIPADSFINRFTREKAEYFIRSVADSNMNMLRVWGGGYYESEDFYDLCDEYGILVWQDFTFACSPYPFYNEEFLENVKKELEYNIKRLRHRASLCLWCGNNEIEMMTPGWMVMKKLIDWSKEFFYNILPEEVKKYDSVTPFINGTPTASEFLKKVNSDDDGDTHLWHVWHGLQPLNYYRKRFTRFCSEFGLESLPDIKTIRGFAEEKDYSLKSDVFMAHQKCASGNSKMLYYMSTRFRIPKSFEHLVYLTQLIQNECVKDATEHWRRNMGRCNGSLYWQLNDCWPVSSWSSIDYEGRYKALQYGAKHFNAPIMVSLEDKKGVVKIHLVNDYLEPFKGKIKWIIEDFDGNKVTEGEIDCSVEGVSSIKADELDCRNFIKDNPNNKVLLVELFDEDECLVSRKTVLFVPEKKAELPKTGITTSVIVSKGIANVTVKSDKYARFVKLDLADSYKPFSDNCFDIMAGEEITVSIQVGKMTADEVAEKLNVLSIADMEPKGSAFSDFMVRLKVSLTPLNIANWIYYYFV